MAINFGQDYAEDVKCYNEELEQIGKYEEEIEKLWNSIELKINRILNEEGVSTEKTISRRRN